MESFYVAPLNGFTSSISHRVEFENTAGDGWCDDSPASRREGCRRSGSSPVQRACAAWALRRRRRRRATRCRWVAGGHPWRTWAGCTPVRGNIIRPPVRTGDWKKLRIGPLAKVWHGAAEKARERGTNPTISRRTYSPRYGLRPSRGKSAGVAKRQRELISHPKPLT
jgi:hypothetical protein